MGVSGIAIGVTGGPDARKVRTELIIYIDCAKT